MPLGEVRSSFDFGGHTRGDMIHGLVVANNHEVYRAGGGCSWHPHRDVEMVFVVVRGTLRHRDSLGNDDVFIAGDAFHVGAGSGVWHAHENGGPTDDVSFVQTWVLPFRAGSPPSRGAARQAVRPGHVSLLASEAGGALSIRQPHAQLFAVNGQPGQVFSVPAPDHGHVYVASGEAEFRDVGHLVEGDALRCRGAGPLEMVVRGSKDCLVLVWATSGPPPGW